VRLGLKRVSREKPVAISEECGLLPAREKGGGLLSRRRGKKRPVPHLRKSIIRTESARSTRGEGNSLEKEKVDHKLAAAGGEGGRDHIRRKELTPC